MSSWLNLKTYVFSGAWIRNFVMWSAFVVMLSSSIMSDGVAILVMPPFLSLLYHIQVTTVKL